MTHVNRFHDPLEPADSVEETVGCRHTNAMICRNNSMHAVCAFVRADGMCKSPPRSWPVQYQKLLQVQDLKKENS